MDRKLQWAKMKGVICEGKLDCVWVINFNTSERQGKMHRWNLDVNAILLGHNYIYWDVWNGVLGLMQKMEGWLLSTAEMSHPLPGLSLTWECTLISLLSKNDQFSSFQKHCFLCVVKFYQRNTRLHSEQVCWRSTVQPIFSFSFFQRFSNNSQTLKMLKRGKQISIYATTKY